MKEQGTVQVSKATGAKQTVKSLAQEEAVGFIARLKCCSGAPRAI